MATKKLTKNNELTDALAANKYLTRRNDELTKKTQELARHIAEKTLPRLAIPSAYLQAVSLAHQSNSHYNAARDAAILLDLAVGEIQAGVKELIGVVNDDAKQI